MAPSRLQLDWSRVISVRLRVRGTQQLRLFDDTMLEQAPAPKHFARFLSPAGTTSNPNFR